MVIYLMHPVHGTKVAVMEAEATYDETKGWVRCIPDVSVELADTAEEEFVELEEPKVILPKQDSERQELTKQYIDKFGSKPHWKMSLEKIKEKLCQPPSTS